MTVFVDTNVLLYARDDRTPEKAAVARAWIGALASRRSLVLSRQSLNEFYNRLTRKFTWVPVEEARNAYLVLEEYATAPFDRMQVMRAWGLQDRYKTGFFDSVLLASSLAVGCRFFVSEDLQSGQVIETVRIVNPFTTPLDNVLPHG